MDQIERGRGEVCQQYEMANSSCRKKPEGFENDRPAIISQHMLLMLLSSIALVDTVVVDVVVVDAAVVSVVVAIYCRLGTGKMFWPFPIANITEIHEERLIRSTIHERESKTF